MSKIDLDNVELIIFGDFSVLTNTPFLDKQPLHMLPGRVEYLAQLRKDRAQRGGPELQYAVVGNKGGVAFGIQTEDEAEAEVAWTAEQIGAATYAVCFAHPAPAVGFERYAAPELLANRKPSPGLLVHIIEMLCVAKERVLVVGNYADDCRAAKSLGLAYEITGVFFAKAEQYAQKPLAVSALSQEELNEIENFDPFLPEESE